MMMMKQIGDMIDVMKIVKELIEIVEIELKMKMKSVTLLIRLD
jgi:hypothetical protein